MGQGNVVLHANKGTFKLSQLVAEKEDNLFKDKETEGLNEVHFLLNVLVIGIYI